MINFQKRPHKLLIMQDSDPYNQTIGAEQDYSLIQAPHDESLIPGMSEALELPVSAEHNMYE